MSIGVVILAAGESTRMGTPKQLLAYRGKALLDHSIDTALSLPDAPVVVVLGAHAAQIRTHLDRDPRVSVAVNEDWRDGMGGSVRTGLNALLARHPSLSAALFLLCDQPLLSGNIVSDLVAALERNPCTIVASEYDGALGVPAVFDRALFPELLALKGASGAKQVIRKHRTDTIGVPFPGGGIDIDTPDDYHRLPVPPRELSKLKTV